MQFIQDLTKICRFLSLEKLDFNVETKTLLQDLTESLGSSTSPYLDSSFPCFLSTCYIRYPVTYQYFSESSP